MEVAFCDFCGKAIAPKFGWKMELSKIDDDVMIDKNYKDVKILHLCDNCAALPLFKDALTGQHRKISTLANCSIKDFQNPEKVATRAASDDIVLESYDIY